MEICDGGELSKKSEEKFPLTVEGRLARAGGRDAAGEARWAFVNLGAAAKTYLNSALKAKKWYVSTAYCRSRCCSPRASTCRSSRAPANGLSRSRTSNSSPKGSA